ncbi:MAG: OadG family protein [Bacillota bacterium]|nr:OadG family protein [Bacillota bacterium]
MEKLNFAMQVMVVGFMVVMVILFLLYGILSMFSKVFNQQGKSKPERVVSGGDISAQLLKNVGDDEGRRVAAIIGAVYQYLQYDKALKFKKPITVAVKSGWSGSTTSWKINGRKELMDSNLMIDQMRRSKKREKI